MSAGRRVPRGMSLAIIQVCLLAFHNHRQVSGLHSTRNSFVSAMAAGASNAFLICHKASIPRVIQCFCTTKFPGPCKSCLCSCTTVCSGASKRLSTILLLLLLLRVVVVAVWFMNDCGQSGRQFATVWQILRVVACVCAEIFMGGACPHPIYYCWRRQNNPYAHEKKNDEFAPHLCVCVCPVANLPFISDRMRCMDNQKAMGLAHQPSHVLGTSSSATCSSSSTSNNHNSGQLDY